MAEDTRHTGGCLCGAIRYAVDAPMRPVVACHCSQCRRTSGHFVAATAAPRHAVRVEGRENLTWFRSSGQARRGFCRTCGSNLFWARDGADYLSIMAGTLDRPTGLRIAGHVFIDDKGDYYDIEGNVPRHRNGDHGLRPPGSAGRS